MIEEVKKKIQSKLLKKSSPIIIAIDGASGSGKSTFAKEISLALECTVIPLDDFFSANIPNYMWDNFTVKEKLEKIFDWDKLIKCAIKPLLKGDKASWTTFDFESGIQSDGTYNLTTDLVTVTPKNIIFLEGAYAASSKIIDFIDLTVLIDISKAERHYRLSKREEENFLKNWHSRWDEVEEYYFDIERPKEFYDIVL